MVPLRRRRVAIILVIISIIYGHRRHAARRLSRPMLIFDVFATPRHDTPFAATPARLPPICRCL